MKEDVITDINEMKFLGDRTNIAEALEMNVSMLVCNVWKCTLIYI